MTAGTGRRLDGKVAVVFGAGSRSTELSNGRAAALVFASEGAAVVSVDRDPEQAELTARSITDAGGRAVSVPADVTEEKDVVAALEATTTRFGAPTVLHNNVGASETGSLLDLDLATWEAQLRLNVTGAFLTTKHVVPAMIDAGGGSIVNVSAVSSQRHPGSDQVVAYTTAKAALNHLTQSTALSYAAQGVRANALLLGLIDTPIAAGEDPTRTVDLREARDRRSPTGRSGTPWDVARAAAFLASDEAGYINGVCLPVDGGLHFGP